MRFKQYKSLVQNVIYVNNAGSFGHSFLEAKIYPMGQNSFEIHLTDGYVIKTVKWEENLDKAKRTALRLLKGGHNE